jgi:hypothetical protein
MALPYWRNLLRIEQAEDVTIAIIPRRWSAWDICSTFLAAVQEVGLPLNAAERSWFKA